jgi:broad specificity phosphatase PhoE
MALPRTTVHLVRHGEVFNPGGVLYERLPDFHLSDLGQAMANRLGDYFAGRPNSAQMIVASPLERAQETAAPIAEALGLPIGLDPRVIESASRFAGLRINAATLARPANARHLFNPLRPSWGEPYQQIAARMADALADVLAQAQGGEAVVVSHQSPIWRLRLHLTGHPLWPMPRGRSCSLASVTTLVYEAGQLRAIAYREPAADLLPAELR